MVYIVPTTREVVWRESNCLSIEYVGNIPAEERDEIVERLNEEMRRLLATNKEVTVSYEGKTRIVSVGNLPCPCGGTHVKNIGDIKVRCTWNLWQRPEHDKGSI